MLVSALDCAVETAVEAIPAQPADTADGGFDVVVLCHEPGGAGLDPQQRSALLQRHAVLHLLADAVDCEAIARTQVEHEDFVLKPFEARELVARIMALRRRAQRRVASEPAPQALPSCSTPGAGEEIDFAGYRLSTGSPWVTAPSGRTFVLQKSGRHLLDVFLAHPQRLLSRERLMTLLGEDLGAGHFDRAIDMRVQRLRRALGLAAEGAGGLIETHRGQGYMLAANVTRS